MKLKRVHPVVIRAKRLDKKPTLEHLIHRLNREDDNLQSVSLEFQSEPALLSPKFRFQRIHCQGESLYKLECRQFASLGRKIVLHLVRRGAIGYRFPLHHRPPNSAVIWLFPSKRMLFYSASLYLGTIKERQSGELLICLDYN